MTRDARCLLKDVILSPRKRPPHSRNKQVYQLKVFDCSNYLVEQFSIARLIERSEGVGRQEQDHE